MKSRTMYLICRNRAKLEKMITDNKPYEKIVKQSQLLDKYIIEQMKSLNKIDN